MAKAFNECFSIQICFTVRSPHDIQQDFFKEFPLVLVSVTTYLSFFL